MPISFLLYLQVKCTTEKSSPLFDWRNTAEFAFAERQRYDNYRETKRIV